MIRVVGLSLALLFAAAPGVAHAWGADGHRLVGWAAAKALPAELPRFLRTAQAADDIAELSREPDRAKDAGKVHDSDREPAHFVDLHDDGAITGGPTLSQLPPTRKDYESALRAAGTTSWDAGYLPYAIVDRWQQLAKDFAYWRVLDAAERNPKWAAHRAWFAADRRRREALIFRSLGELSHFVADGSQPLHVSIHYNGWGAFPNPAGYTRSRIHAPFEGALVHASVKLGDVTSRMAPLRLCDCPIEARTADYLIESHRRLIPLYELEKAGGLASGDPRGPRFASVQLARGASELRDLVVAAWRDSRGQEVGWKPVAVADVLSGKVDPYPSLLTVD